MKSLINILEERMRVGSLPFTREEFKKYAPDSWDDDIEFIKEIDKRIEKQYGKAVLNTFRGWVEGSWYDSDLDILYDVLQNVPLNRLNKMLGAGSNGIVIEANDKIIKWFHKNTPMTSEDRKFYEYCMSRPTKVFPIVYKLGKNFVVMEKLRTGTPKCKLYDSYLGFDGKKIDVNGKQITLDKIIYNPTSDALNVLKKDKEAWKIFQWGSEAIKHLEKAVGFTEFSDLRLANIGERKNGEIVWFDI